MTAGLDPRPTAVLAELGLGPCRWDFPPPDAADGHGLVVVGGDLEPETLVSAYCQGLFPMPFGRRRRIGWWSPDPRATIPVDELVVSRSLRRSCKRYEVRVDTAFRDTMTLLLHGICCDIDVETGPRQIPSRFLRKRLEALKALFPPPEGHAVFPEDLPQKQTLV